MERDEGELRMTEDASLLPRSWKAFAVTPFPECNDCAYWTIRALSRFVTRVGQLTARGRDWNCGIWIRARKL